MNPLLLFCIHLLFERVNQSLIIGLNPKVSVPSDWTDLRWPRRIMFFEGSEFFSMSRRNEKFHRKGLSVQFWSESANHAAKADLRPHYVTALRV